MGFLSNIVSAVVKTATTPVAIVKDIVSTAKGEEANATKKHAESVMDDVKDALDDIT